MFVEESGRLFVHTFDQAYESHLKDFLVSCCEPVSRPHFVNEYAITPSSLSAASSEGSYTMTDICRILSSNSKQIPGDVGCDAPCSSGVPEAVLQMIDDEERSEKVQLVLQPSFGQRTSARQQHSASSDVPLVYCLQCLDRAYLDKVAQDLKHLLEPVTVGGTSVWVISDLEQLSLAELRQQRRAGDFGAAKRRRDGEGFDEEPKKGADAVFSSRGSAMKATVVYKCRVKTGQQRQVREALSRMHIRVQCTYDFLRDSTTAPVTGFALKLGVRLRPYQEASLERFRRGNKAHNGVVVLPCGAGKTLTGIAAASVVGKRVIVMCCNVMSVMQWKREFLRWTTLREEQVTVCAFGEKQRPGDVFITTYNMLTAKRAARPVGSVKTESAILTEQILSDVQSATWGMLLLDEVHIAPAEKFQEVINRVRHHCVLGLSATLLREDQRIENLKFLVGPKLYEANWLELTERGFLAPVVCVDVRCPMPPQYLRMYLDPVRSDSDESLRDLASISPYKLWATQALLRYHGSMNPPDKVIIFCDAIKAVEYYALTLGVPFMDGATPEPERAKLLQYFRSSASVNVILLSRVGDIALDIPEASVIIQLSGLGASRRQEAQRLGRILRPKPPSVDNSSAYFYTLVSEDTDETRNAFGRQEWLRDQGFAYRMISAKEILTHIASESRRTEDVTLARRPFQCLCIGPPRWYWECNGSEPAAMLEHYVVARTAPLATPAWVHFSRVESELIERAFRDGLPAVTLLGDHNKHHHEHKTRGHGGKEKSTVSPTTFIAGCRVQFDSADAPNSFGTLTVEVEGADSLQRTTTIRRVAKNVLETTVLGWSAAERTGHQLHDCMLSDECLSYLVQRVMNAHPR